MAKPWVVICGLVRDERHLLRKLETLGRWKVEGVIEEVVLSTWVGELDLYPRIRRAHGQGAFVLVESDAPTVNTPGHTLHQARSLFSGLQAVPPGVCVLKLRPDVVELIDSMSDALRGVDLSLDELGGWPKIFDSKVCIVNHSIDRPFYMNDMVFFGSKEDLEKLCSFDLFPEFFYKKPSPEQFFFSSPFRGQFPLMDAYAQAAPSIIFDYPEAGQIRQNVLLNSDAFLDFVAFNARFVRRYFRVGFFADRIRMPLQTPPGGVDLEQALGLDGGPGIAFHPPSHCSTVFDELFGQVLLERRFVMNAFGRRMAAALDRTEDPEYWRNYPANPLQTSPDIQSLQEALKAALPSLDDGAVTVSADRRTIRFNSAPERISLSIDNPEHERMQTEINRLRRLVGSLQGDSEAATPSKGGILGGVRRWVKKHRA